MHKFSYSFYENSFVYFPHQNEKQEKQRKNHFGVASKSPAITDESFAKVWSAPMIFSLWKTTEERKQKLKNFIWPKIVAHRMRHH